jgi:hypothetical protein
MKVLRTAAPLNLQRLAGFHSIREGLHVVTHDIKALLATGMSQLEPNPSWDLESALPPSWLRRRRGHKGRVLTNPGAFQLESWGP